MNLRDDFDNENSGYIKTSPFIFYILTAVFFLFYNYTVLWGASLSTLVALPSDDAFYYYKIARNITLGRGCTFDGIVPTNGFHPLWMVCILPIFRIFDGDLETPVRLVLALNGIICLALFGMVYRLVNRYVAPGFGGVAVATCLLPFILSSVTNGMETGLLLLMFSIFIYVCYRKEIHDPQSGFKAALGTGVMLGIIFLSRLDSIFWLFSVLLLTVISACLCRMSIKKIIYRILIICVGFGIIVVPYMIWNLLAFGHFMPVSGQVKSTFPSLRNPLNLEGDLKLGAVMISAVLFLMTIIVTYDYRRTKTIKSILTSPLLILTLGCVFHYLHEFLFISWGVYWWHFAVYGLTVALALPRAAWLITAEHPRWRWVAIPSLVVSLFALAIAVNVHVLTTKYYQHREWLAAAEWARENTPDDAVFGIKDAGLFGYFSDRCIINLDGKANGSEYQLSMKSDDVFSYLEKVNVKYLADIHARYYKGQYRIYLPRPNQPGIILCVAESDEIFRSNDIPETNVMRKSPKAHFAIWQYNGKVLP